MLVTCYQLTGILQTPLNDLSRFKSHYASNLTSIRMLRSLARDASRPSGFGRLRRAR